ncbi:MAG TPA: GAF domain-containing sensor histidine kinase [Caldilineae bacterium]|nr:GAF domain-containing sensor histidine kinase [Caldilineae bacterium]
MQRLIAAWKQLQKAPLHQQLRMLRWNAPLVVLALAAGHQLVVATIIRPAPSQWDWWLELLIYSVTGSIAVWIGMTIIASAVAQSAEAEDDLRVAYAELEASHEDLLALDRLGALVSQTGSEQTLLELAAQAPLQLTDAISSTMVTFDTEGERLKLDMAWGLSDTYLHALQTRIDDGVISSRCQSCSALHAHVDGDCPLFDGLQPLAKAEGIGSLVCLPINNEQERIGILTAYFPSIDGPPENQMRLLNILGGVIASSLDSIRIRSRQVDTLHALDRVAQTNDALDDLAGKVLDIAVSGWDAQGAALVLTEDDEWLWRAHRGMLDDPADARYALATQFIREAMNQGAPVIKSHIAAAKHGFRSAAATPLMTEDHSLGALFLGAERNEGFHDRHRELLVTMAHQVALAIRNAQLYDELRQMAVIKERLRLSREFHDGLAQTLGFLGLQVERVESLLAENQIERAETELSTMRQTIQSAYTDVREAIDGLRFTTRHPEHLADHLADYVDDFALQTGIDARFIAVPDDLTVATTTSVQLFRIAQEALTNTRKHAQAKQVEVRLQATTEEIELTIADDGVGFPQITQTQRKFRSHGLNSMRERAESLGGVLTIATSPDQGVRITALVPLS